MSNVYGSLSHLRPLAEMLIANAMRMPPPPPAKPGMAPPATGSWNDIFEQSAERTVLPPVTYSPAPHEAQGGAADGTPGQVG